MFSSSSRTQRHVRKSEKKDRDHRSKESSSSSSSKQHQQQQQQQQQQPERTPFSFLFVVNEFRIFDEGNGLAPRSDRFGNPLPPNTADGYDTEIPGTVWRYQDGIVSPAPGYVWWRPVQRAEGTISVIRYHDDDNAGDGLGQGQYGQGQPTWTYEPMGVYSTHSVFNCWRFLPCIYTHADVSTVEEMDVDYKWNQLEFRHDPYEPGVTRIPGSERHVAGRQGSVSWIPGLLPETYASPSSHAPPSRGLGGPLGIIIGLIALSRRPGHADNAFREELWRHGRWTGNRHRSAEPDSKGPPRGVMVQICYDSNFNYFGSTYDALVAFEETEKAIIG